MATLSQPRHRSARATINDRKLREAAVGEINRVGVDHISLRDVSHQAGLTHGATYGRFENVDELLVDLWNSTLCDRLIAMFELCRSAVQSPSTETLDVVFELLRHGDERDLAAVELLLISRRIPTLAEECETFIHDYLEPEIGNTIPSDEQFARTNFLFGMMLTRLFSDRQFGIDETYQRWLKELLIDALSLPPAKSVGDHHETLSQRLEGDDRENLPAGDSLRAELTRSTYSVISKSGYVRATISRIARRANCSPGGIYKAHRSKEDLVIGVFSDTIAAKWTNLDDISHLLDENCLEGLLRAEANEHHEHRRGFLLEMFVASAHNDILRTGVWRRLRELEVSVYDRVDIDEETLLRLRYLLRTVMTLAVSVGWLTTLTESSSSFEYSHISEPIRQALLESRFSDWDTVSRELRDVANIGAVAR
jgi:AcrR family transcriptional regulator